jgi:hypothetical protein
MAPTMTAPVGNNKSNIRKLKQRDYSINENDTTILRSVLAANEQESALFTHESLLVAGPVDTHSVAI